jgi:16S rRNA G966 N2-methylase RsmD
MGTLYYGDNVEILRRYLKDETVDLVYLDPPFNSAQNYNAFFQEKDGTAAAKHGFATFLKNYFNTVNTVKFSQFQRVGGEFA